MDDFFGDVEELLAGEFGGEDDAEDGVDQFGLLWHDRSFDAVASSPDNRWLVTGSVDKTARLWNLRLCELVDLAWRTVERNLTKEEWAQYMGAQPYQKNSPTCLSSSVKFGTDQPLAEGHQVPLFSPAVLSPRHRRCNRPEAELRGPDQPHLPSQ